MKQHTLGFIDCGVKQYNYIVVARMENGKHTIIHKCNSQAEAERAKVEGAKNSTYTHVYWSHT